MEILIDLDSHMRVRTGRRSSGRLDIDALSLYKIITIDRRMYCTTTKSLFLKNIFVHLDTQSR